MGPWPLLILAGLLLSLLGTAILIWQLMRPPRKTFAVALAQAQPTSPADLDLTFHDLSLALADGSTTPAWLIQGHDPRGPLVLLVHGFADSRYGSLAWAPLFAPFASQLLLFDLPGHGESPRKSSRGGTTEGRDILAILQQLQPPQGVVLFGYSMGAGIVLTAAAAAAQYDPSLNIRGVIADGIYRHWDEPLRCFLRSRRYPAQPFLFLARLYFTLTLPGFSNFDRTRHARQLRCPLLLLHGAGDGLCPLHSAHAIANAAPQGQLVIIDNGNHLDLAQVDCEQYRLALRSFFFDLAHPPVAPQNAPPSAFPHPIKDLA
jgi:pimeloyl-ACP methyl ester carboxylesterase